MIMPRWNRTVWVDWIVVSCPPCWLPVEAKTLPTLPTNWSSNQSPPVWSRKFFIWDAMLPKRVGVPMMIASYSASSATVATDADWSILYPDLFATASGTSSGTRLIVTSAPASRAPSATASAIVSMCP